MKNMLEAIELTARAVQAIETGAWFACRCLSLSLSLSHPRYHGQKFFLEALCVQGDIPALVAYLAKNPAKSKEIAATWRKYASEREIYTAIPFPFSSTAGSSHGDTAIRFRVLGLTTDRAVVRVYRKKTYRGRHAGRHSSIEQLFILNRVSREVTPLKILRKRELDLDSLLSHGPVPADIGRARI